MNLFRVLSLWYSMRHIEYLDLGMRYNSQTTVKIAQTTWNVNWFIDHSVSVWQVIKSTIILFYRGQGTNYSEQSFLTRCFVTESVAVRFLICFSGIVESHKLASIREAFNWNPPEECNWVLCRFHVTQSQWRSLRTAVLRSLFNHKLSTSLPSRPNIKRYIYLGRNPVEKKEAFSY